MKKGLGMMGILAATLAMTGGMGMGMPEPRTRYNPTPQRRKHLGYYKHIGEIPKGCKVDFEVLTFRKNGYILTLAVEILYGTLKGKWKKINRYKKEIEEYILHLSIEEIIERNEFSSCANEFTSCALEKKEKIK